jgi:phage pi2 protein 07
MGTNYYRVPKSSEIVRRSQDLKLSIENLDLWSASEAKNEFRTIPSKESEYLMLTPWEEFTEELSVHLGKRSGGWKFCWNFHGNKHYSNKKELLEFINSGRVVDEYGMEISTEEFIKMALEWCSDGIVFDAAYVKKMQEKFPNYMQFGPEYYDLEIDGLRVSRSSDFS